MLPSGIWPIPPDESFILPALVRKILAFYGQVPPQPVRKVGISNYNLPPARLWKGWNRLMRHFSDGLPLTENQFCRIQHLSLNNI